MNFPSRMLHLRELPEAFRNPDDLIDLPVFTINTKKHGVLYRVEEGRYDHDIYIEWECGSTSLVQLFLVQKEDSPIYIVLDDLPEKFKPLLELTHTTGE